jgi:hypothetical protein
VSLPENAFRFLYPATPYAVRAGVLQLESEPELTENYTKATFIWLYVCIYLSCLALVFSGSLATKKSKPDTSLLL